MRVTIKLGQSDGLKVGLYVSLAGYMSSRIYLDYNATTPLHPEILPFISDNLSKFGNASSVHWAGREAKKVITIARESVAKFINVNATEIIFTASGSESNNQAIKGSLAPIAGEGFFSARERTEIYYSSVEHPSVVKTVKAMESRGYKAIAIPVNRDGFIDLDFLRKNLGPKTALVSVQLVNNETGNIFPIKDISKLAKASGAIMHSDMVQALGKIPIDLQDLGVDFATLSAHKFYSMKGTGILYVKRGSHLDTFIDGGGQERSRRAGTENALAIGSLGKVVEILGPRMNGQIEKIKTMRDVLERELIAAYPQFMINGTKAPRVANTINITCPQIDGETLLINLDTLGIAVSSGAACSSGSQEPSPVLRAMGLTSSEASESMRISLGWLTTEQEIKTFLTGFKQAVERMSQVQKVQALEGDLDVL